MIDIDWERHYLHQALERLEYQWDFKREALTLHQLSLIAASSYLWGSPRIRQKVRNLFKNYRSYDRKENPKNYIKDMRGKIPEMFSEIINQQHLPQVLKVKLQQKIAEMGEITCDWILHLIYDFQLDFKYADRIYWTATGEIDVDRIFNSYWINFRGERLLQNNMLGDFYQKLSPLYFLACCFAQEKFIIEHQDDIIRDIESVSPSFRRDNDLDVVVDVMSVVICLFYVKCPPSSSWFAHSEPEKRTCDYMLSICEDLYFHKAFSYFWNHMGPEEQQFKLNYKYYSSLSCDYIFKFGKKNFIHLFLFYFNKIGDPEKNIFIVENFDDLFFEILSRERYKKFCMSLLEKYSTYFFRKYTLVYYMNRFMNQLVDDLEKVMKTSDDSYLHFEVFEFIMKRMPKETKVESFLRRSTRPTENFFNLFHIRFLKFIINDKDLEDHRADLIKMGKAKYKLLIEESNFQLLNEFMNEVLLSDEEKNQFKQDFNFLREFINNCQYDIADNVLNWLHGNEAYKFKMQLIHLCCKSVPKNYDCIVKLLKWFFEAQDEPLMNSCKDRTKLLHDFCRELIYNLWFRVEVVNDNDEETEVTLATKILNFVFGADDEIKNFKENELAKEDCVKFFCERLVQYWNVSENKEANFSAVDDFLNFCALTEEKINIIKETVAENVNDYIEKYGVSVARFDIIVPLLDWIYGKNSENCKLLEDKFPNSDDVSSYYKNCL